MRFLAWSCMFLVLAAAGAWLLAEATHGEKSELRAVEVVRGTVVKNAAAIGRVEAEHEVPVKSTFGGLVTAIFVRPGQRVAAGDPLAEVRPEPTTQTYVEAERAVAMAKDGEAQAKEFLDGKHVASWLTRFALGSENLARMQRAASLGRQRAEEQLTLLRDGSVEVDGRKVDFVVRAPVDAHVLVVHVRRGNPIVPSSTYGTGTVLMTLADMQEPVFRGTVDEIDVGRLAEGLAARVSIGALPGRTIDGRLEEIALKGLLRDNATLFEVRIDLRPPEGLTLRAGYSAVAEIEVDRHADVLVVPERVVEFKDGAAFVRVLAGGAPAEVAIRTGLSDGLTVEVLDGLTAGQSVLERTYDD